METSQLRSYNPTEILETYSHIELTADEEIEGKIWAKQQKERRLREEKSKEMADNNRKFLTQTQWSFNQTKDYMKYRALDIFEGKFLLDETNSALFDMLCYYFSDDPLFIVSANVFKIKNPSLSKGIMLAGNFGTGKTWLMKLFSKNQRQVFHIRNAKKIANIFEADGEDVSKEFENKIKNPANDSNSFYQQHAGLCIDDIGTEDIKNHYGNKKNVIGDLIEARYSKGNTGVFLHATSNLSAQQLKDFYGERVTSRIREIFNLIEVPGNDRRK